MRKLIFLLSLLSICLSGLSQNIDFEEELELAKTPVEIDTSQVDVFGQLPAGKFKLDYYHTDGYSSGNRYWYEIIIVDTLLIFNFKSPSNDDWDYINYQKQSIIDSDSLKNILRKIQNSNIQQKVKGIPIPQGSGYGGDRLYIESAEVKLAGGTVYMNVGLDMPEELWQKKIQIEKETSSTISGDFQGLFNYLESLFVDLPILLNSKNKKLQ